MKNILKGESLNGPRKLSITETERLVAKKAFLLYVKSDRNVTYN